MSNLEESPLNLIFDLMIEAEMINTDRRHRIPLLLLMLGLWLRRHRPVIMTKEVLDD